MTIEFRLDRSDHRVAEGADHDPRRGRSTGEGWLYLASVLGLGSRRWLGYSMVDYMGTDLVADALRMAAGTRGAILKGSSFTVIVAPSTCLGPTGTSSPSSGCANQ